MLINVQALILLFLSAANSIQVPTSNVGPSDAKFKQLIEFHSSSLSAYVDVNSDRRTDVIVKNDDNSISVFLEPDARESSGFIFGLKKKTLPSRVDLISNSTFTEKIQSITATDFNGDSVVDLFVLTSDNSDPPYKGFICYGIKNPEFKLGDPVLVDTFEGQPLIADFNGDRVADIYGQVKEKRVAYFGGTKLQKVNDEKYSGPRWFKIGYTAFGDFNSDGISDALITVSTDNGMAFQFLSKAMETGKKVPDFSKANIIELPAQVYEAHANAVVGQFRLGDFNMDGNIDILLPVCTTLNCKGTSRLFMLNLKDLKWTEIPLDLKPAGLDSSWSGTWSFTPTKGEFDLSTSQLVGFSHGDLDLDSFLDLTIALTYWDGSKKVVVPALLMSKSCTKFKAFLLPGFVSPDTEVHQIAFFDQGEDGILDLWMVTEKDNFKTARLVQQLQSSNNYFLMVMVLNGLCQPPSTCSLPYGLPVPGSSSSYSTYTIDGKLEKSTAVQTPLSTFNSLELPYMIFGLNELGNYIENVHAYVPDKENTNLARKTEFTVPDSQLVVNPYPKESPDNWKVTLYLQPLYNMKVLFIAITLLGLCIVLAIIIGILQCLEKKEDEREKMTEAQGFHFDSM